MENKLELKHYLDAFLHKTPCRLSTIGKFNLDSEFGNSNANTIGYISEIGFNEEGIYGVLKVTNNYSFDFDFKMNEEVEIEFLKRPLSDLTKEIEHNGEKFVPIDELWKLTQCDNDCDFLTAFQDSCFDVCKIDVAPYHIVQTLLSWHFDSYDLISKNLAVDTNTLKSEK